MKKLTKNLFLLALSVVALNTLSAQVGKGAWMVGGSIGFDSDKFKDADDATVTIELAPNIAYFVIDNLGIGLSVNYTSIKQGDEKFSSTGIEPWARYYAYKNLFAQAGYEILSAKLGDEDAVNGGNINIGIGYSWFLNNSIAIEPKLGYSIGSGDARKDFSTFGLTIGVQAFLGRD
ncbi:MAG: hypothetical protein HOP11_06135 [Saprospiraceae bacterium]|nr:hypothetical protein [Saprospiraceae bacterium]